MYFLFGVLQSYARLVVVDLAGSERATRTKATGHHLKEANKINQSLMTLNRVMRIMRTNQDAHHKQHVPFRDSKLTSFFEHNLTNPRSGGIVMIVNINPDAAEHSETISVLENSSIARDVTYQKPVVERTARTAKYDAHGRKLKSKKQLAAEAKRLAESVSTRKKVKLATSQNLDQSHKQK